MDIFASGTFEYEAEFTDDSFRASDILLQGVDTTGFSAERLVGLRPQIRLCEDRLVIFTSEQRGGRGKTRLLRGRRRARPRGPPRRPSLPL